MSSNSAASGAYVRIKSKSASVDVVSVEEMEAEIARVFYTETWQSSLANIFPADKGEE